MNVASITAMAMIHIKAPDEETAISPASFPPFARLPAALFIRGDLCRARRTHLYFIGKHNQ